MVYKVNKDKADVISVFAESHPVDGEVTEGSEAVKDARDQSSSSNQEQGLPGSSIQGGRKDRSKHGKDNDDDPGAIRACLDVELASTSTGAKAFTALKRATDEELDNSHNEHRPSDTTSRLNLSMMFTEHTSSGNTRPTTRRTCPRKMRSVQEEILQGHQGRCDPCQYRRHVYQDSCCYSC